jgi:flagellar FliJ protein
MKPFKLKAVLNYRKRLQDIARNRLFEAQKIQEIISQKLESEKNIFSVLIQECDRLQKEGITVSELIRYEERFTFLKGTIKAIEKTLLEKTEIVEKEQQNLILRSKELQIMERLKEQQDRDYEAFLNKKEAAMLDETAILRHDSNPL